MQGNDLEALPYRIKRAGNDMEKKTVFIYLVSSVILFCFGFFSGGVGPGRKADQLENKVVELRARAEGLSGQVESLRARAEKLNARIAELDGQNRELDRNIEELQRVNEILESGIAGVNDSVSDSRERIEKTADGIGGIRDEIRSYIEEAGTAE